MTIDAVIVNSAAATLAKYRITTSGSIGPWTTPTAGINLKPGDTADIAVTISGNFQSGTKYEITLHTAAGNNYPYTETAP